MRNVVGIIILLILSGINLSGQSGGINRDRYRISIAETDQVITVDGVLDEEVWAKADYVTNFQRVLPTDTGFAKAQTEVRLAYDHSNLYIGAICYDPSPGKRPVESLRKDFNFLKNDNFMVIMDTFDDKTNGFIFAVNAAGSERDGSQSNGGTVNNDWETKWRSAIKSYNDRWTTEFSIPFRSIRYPGGAPEWGINFSRLDLKSNEKSSWAPMPRQFATANLAYTGTLEWDKPLSGSGLRFSLIPYISGKVIKDNESMEDADLTGSAGLDAKVILSTSMNLDLTINPDFSQVEVDKQQTNLDRYELFFPEKRQFFLENSDLFANLGTGDARPFFSRRIGLDASVRAGARLSGKIGNDWRIGLMDMQTAAENDIPASNYAVAVLQKKVFTRSNITGFFINKESHLLQADTTFSGYRYNRVAGLEYNLASANNHWTGKAFYHQSLYPGSTVKAASYSGNLTYSTQYLLASLNQIWIGSDYTAEAGYIRRKGFYKISPGLQYRFYPDKGIIVNHGPSVKFELIFSPGHDITDRETHFKYMFEFQNTSTLTLDLEEEYVRLPEPFDPTNTGGEKLVPGMAFNWRRPGICFVYDPRKMFNYTISSSYGGYFNGQRLNVSGEAIYRFQPYGSISITGSYNDISLPKPYNSAGFVLIGPKLDVTFTNKLFLSALIQYNNQIDNINSNIRFQWRFAPGSDLYIVYTGNSYSYDYQNKNRGLVVKLSYWFN